MLFAICLVFHYIGTITAKQSCSMRTELLRHNMVQVLEVAFDIAMELVTRFTFFIRNKLSGFSLHVS